MHVRSASDSSYPPLSTQVRLNVTGMAKQRPILVKADLFLVYVMGAYPVVRYCGIILLYICVHYFKPYF